jgi:hypothetical protein
MTKFTMHVRISTAIRVLAVVCAVWASVFPAAAQDDKLNVVGFVTDEADRKKLAGVEVSVTRDGAPFDVLMTDAKGAYDFQLPLRYDYVFSFTYPGYGVKRIRVDGSKVPPEDLKGGFRLDMPMSLFKLIDGFNTAILEDYFGKATFDPVKNTISFDMAHTDAMRNRVKQEFERVARMAGDLAKMRQDFAALLAKGKAAMTATNWDQALSDFTAARAIFPDDQEAQQLQKQAQARVDEKAAAAAAEKKFQETIKAAEADLKADKLDSAAERFRGAAELKPFAPEPADGLKRIEARRAVLAADASYTQAIVEADALFAAAKYADASKAYALASGMKPAESYPRTRKAEADRFQADAAAASAAQAERQNRYESLIATADKAFKAKSFAEAKSAYEEALRVLPTEPYPKERLTACQTELDKAAWAASAADAANQSAQAQKELEAKYAAHISAGDAAYGKSEWEAARAAYRKSLELKPGDNYATQRLERITKEEALAQQALDKSRDEADRKAAQAERDRLKAEEDAARRAAEEAARNQAAEEAARRRTRLEAEAQQNNVEALETLAEEEKARTRLLRQQADASESRVDANSGRRGRAQNRNADGDASARNPEVEFYANVRAENEKRIDRTLQSEVERAQSGVQGSIANADAVAANSERILGEAEREDATAEDRRQEVVSTRVVKQEEGFEEIERERKITFQRGEAGAQQRVDEVEFLIQAQQTQPLTDRTLEAEQEIEGVIEDTRSRVVAGLDASDAVAAETESTVMQQASFELSFEGAEEAALQASYQEILRQQEEHKAWLTWREAVANRESMETELDLQSLEQAAASIGFTGTELESSPVVTEESYDIDNGLVVVRKVQRGNVVRIYRKVVYVFGTYYFDGNQNITERDWLRETSVTP